MAGKDDDVKLVKVRLKNTGKFIYVNEEGAAAVEEEEKVSGANLESTMSELEGKNEELAAVQSEVEELKGELSVYKEKLDALLSEEAVEHAAEEMVEETGEAEEIIENATFLNEKEEEDEKKKEETVACDSVTECCGCIFSEAENCCSFGWMAERLGRSVRPWNAYAAN